MSLEPKDREQLVEYITQAMTSAIGPTADLIRAKMAAEVDGLCDAYIKFTAAGWPQWMINSIMLGLINATPVSTGGPKE